MHNKEMHGHPDAVFGQGPNGGHTLEDMRCLFHIVIIYCFFFLNKQ